MTLNTGLLISSFLLASVLVPATDTFAQQRDLYTQRLVLDDNGGGGTLNRMTLATAGDLPTDRTLTIPDPGVDGAEFLLAVSGSAGLSEIETPNADETLRLNPSGDLVRIGNQGNPSAGSGLEAYGNALLSGPELVLDASNGSASLAVEGNRITMIAESVTINGNLVVSGHLRVNGGLTVDAANNLIGTGSNLTQLEVRGENGGSGDHLYVVGNVRLTNELRIGSGGNTTAFKTGSQAAQITYTLPTALPAAAATGTSMGNGLMQTASDGTMSWRNVGTTSAALNFASTNDGATNDQTITVTGAVAGDLVMLGIPGNVQPTGSAWYQAWVSANDVVTVRFFNESGATVDPASGTFSVMVMRP